MSDERCRRVGPIVWNDFRALSNFAYFVSGVDVVVFLWNNLLDFIVAWSSNLFFIHQFHDKWRAQLLTIQFLYDGECQSNFFFIHVVVGDVLA